MAFRALVRLGIDPVPDASGERIYMLNQRGGRPASRMPGETAELHDRAMKIGDAANRLGVVHSTVRKWIKARRLEVDEQRTRPYPFLAVP
jgi:hypothetical protein